MTRPVYLPALDDRRCVNCGAPTQRVELADPPKPGYWVQRYVPPVSSGAPPAARRAPTEAMIEAAHALVAKLDECAPHIDAAFTLQHVHGAPYRGPNYEAELGALRAALAAQGEPDSSPGGVRPP